MYLKSDAYQTFFDDSPQPMWVFDSTDGRFLQVNRAACTRYGYTKDEFLGMRLADIRRPEDADELSEALAQFRITNKVSTPKIWQHRTKSGQIMDVEVLSTGIEIDGVRAGFAVLRDVTRERSLTLERDRFFELSSDIMVVRDEDMRLIRANPAMERILGWSPEETLSLSPLELIHPEDSRTFSEALTRSFDDGNALTWEARVRTKEGGYRWIQWSGASDKPNARFYAIGRDVTERKKSEEALIWFAEIVASSVDAIIGKDLDGIVQSWNKAAEVLYGYTEEEMVGQSLTRIIPSHRGDELESILEQVRRGERIREYETERIDRHGRMFEASITVSPIQTEDGQIVGAASIGRDISARKEADRLLRTQLMQLGALRKVDLSITGTYDIATTLNVVGAEVLATSEAESVCFFIKDRATNTPRLVSCATRDGGAVSEENLAAAETMVRHALSSPSPEAFTPDFGSRCHVLPLDAQGETMGSMAVHFDPIGKRAREQMKFFRTLAGQASIAIEAAWLFEDAQRSNQDLRAAYDETLEGWSRALDLRDHETEGHSRRVTDLAVRLALKLGLPAADIANIRRGALLHDIGKLGVPDHILLKAGPLTDEEFAEMKKHPEFGYEILKPIAFLNQTLEIPYCHHEKWDGTGYPRGLRGKEIPLAARIFALADVWDALASDRPYRKAWSIDRIRRHFDSEAGRHFDPSLLAPFFEILDE